MQLIPHIILMLEGFSAFLDETCDTDCDDLTPIEDWKIEKIGCNGTKSGCFPSLEQLRRLCPQTLNFLNCKSKKTETCDELTAAPNTNLSVLTKYSMNVENLVRDLCNENSSFHKDYFSEIKCYKGMHFMVTGICWQIFNRTKREFVEYLDLMDKDIPNEVKCLMIDFQDACLADRFEWFCDKAAQRIFLETQRIFKNIFSLDCSQADEKWTTNFFNFLRKMRRVTFKETFRIV